MTEGMPPLDPDRSLILAYVPARYRAAIRALWQLDAALGSILSGGREPAIKQIKLAWWREALERLDQAPPPAQPLLQDLASHVLPAGLSGAELAGLEEGWAALLADHALTEENLETYSAGRGRRLFALSARLLRAEVEEDQLRAGEGWALADLARHSGEPDAGSAIAAAETVLPRRHWKSPLRPLGMLAVLAIRDVEGGIARQEMPGSPARMARLLRHRLSGS